MKKLLHGLQTALTVLLALLLACNLYALAAAKLTGGRQPSLFGLSSAVVVSGSMEPALSAGDWIVIRR